MIFPFSQAAENDPYASLPLNRLAATYCKYASARRPFARLASGPFEQPARGFFQRPASDYVGIRNPCNRYPESRPRRLIVLKKYLNLCVVSIDYVKTNVTYRSSASHGILPSTADNPRHAREKMSSFIGLISTRA
jgi:hypothetical protein